MEISSDDLMQKIAPHWYSRRANDDRSVYYADYILAFGAWLHVHVTHEGNLHSMKWTDYQFETWVREEAEIRDSEIKSLLTNKSVFVKRLQHHLQTSAPSAAKGHNKYLLLA